MPEELKKMNIVAGKATIEKMVVAGKATIEKMVEERAESEEKKRKTRLIDEGVKRMCFPKGSDPGETLNFAEYQGCRLGDVCMKDPAYAELATTIEKPRGSNFKCFKFFARRLLDLERVVQQESEEGTAKVEMMEASKNLTEEMVSEERKVVEECRVETGAESSMG